MTKLTKTIRRTLATIALTATINNPLLAGEAKILGETKVRVGDTISLVAVDKNGEIPYMHEKEMTKGIWIISGPLNYNTNKKFVEYQEDADNNAYTRQIQFKLPGIYTIWCRYLDEDYHASSMTIQVSEKK